jgi:hypothetical protein
MNSNDIYATQRTPEGLKYEKAMREFRNLDPDVISKVKAELWEGIHTKSLAAGDVYSNRTIQTMSVQYKNDDYIGDQLMPVVDIGDQPTGVYFTYNKHDRFEAPSDLMSEREEANEIEEGRTKTTFTCADYGLMNSISAKSVSAEDAPLNELMDLSESLNDLLALKREVRQANILCTASNYDSANTTTLSGSNQWNSGSGGDPVKDIQTARAACWNGRGRGDFVGFCSRSVWNVLARHQALLDLFKYTGQGLLPQDVMAKWFGLRTILVGDARKQTANEGQTASYSRIWSDVFGIVRVASTASVRNAAFAYTLRVNGQPRATQWFKPELGLKGRYFAKVTTSDAYQVVANDTGYLIASPIG